MNAAVPFLLNYGGPILFAAVLAQQLGLPLPAPLLLLAAGALAASGDLSLPVAVGVTVLACLLGDLFWFYLGRRGGNRVLRFLCRISLEPDTCVRRSEDAFGRYGMEGVVISKFVPGLNTMMPPLAGVCGTPTGRFLLFDTLGSSLFCGFYILMGLLFHDQLEPIGAALARGGRSTLMVLAGAIAAYVGFKCLQRQRLLRRLRTARITADELRRKQEAGEDLFILDLRSSRELGQDPAVILGASHLPPEEVEHRHHEIPRDRDVIVYCSCPNEITSARVAMLLQRKGITRVRPLLGGIDTWRERQYPTVPHPAFVRAAAGS